MTATPSVVWRKIDYPRSDHPNPQAIRMYLRSATDFKSWSTRKADAHVFGTKTEAARMARQLRHPALTKGTEPAGPACPTCRGPSRWVDDFWVCNACGDAAVLGPGHAETAPPGIFSGRPRRGGEGAAEGGASRCQRASL